jgi:hypothetical protein
MKTATCPANKVLRDNTAGDLLRHLSGQWCSTLDHAGEDPEADTDATPAATGDGRITSVQGTVKTLSPAGRVSGAGMELARKGVARLVDLQNWPRVSDRSCNCRITGRLVIATHNAAQAFAEMRELLAPHGVEAVSAGGLAPGEPEETGDTFRANAVNIKATRASKATGFAALLSM